MQQDDVRDLLNRYLDGKCSDDEKAVLESWYLKYEVEDLPEIPQRIRDEHLNAVWESLPIHHSKKKVHALWPYISAAAILLIVLSAGLYFYGRQNNTEQQYTKNQIIPGGNKAILTLSDGRKISLTEASNGEIAEQSGIKILKTADGQLIYTAVNTTGDNRVSFNTIETPKGGQYQVMLPDSTKVWLNASSSLKFPASFSNLKERRVEMRGEAYFEVKHNEHKPFRVIAGNQQVEVLGTHFNIMSYREEGEIRTTLLEGAVKLSSNRQLAVLKPGQQGFISNGSEKYTIDYVDVSAVTAWKDGLFYFDNTDLRSLMGQISRWYDVEVVFQPGVNEDKFSGKIERSSDLATVLKVLEVGGVHFKVDGRKLIVQP
ncbi:MAG TPA: FecR domain-containing protein [Sphingobacteriaceae bacterium]